MSVISILLIIPPGLIVLLHLVMYGGIFVGRRRERRLESIGASLSATVVVPARNEERLLPNLLKTLDEQSETDFAIVLVDDRSVDATGEIMDRYASQNQRARVIHLEEVENIGNPKLYALIKGAELAKGDIVLFTDADCEVPKSWIEEMGRSFREESVGLVLGPIETHRNEQPVSTFHCFDHIFKYAYTAGCTGINQATGGFGNNLAVRRVALEEVGGLEAIEVSVTEDAALVAEIRQKTIWQIRARFDRSATVLTAPQPDLRALTMQEIRWHSGGLFSADLTSRLSYRFIMFYLTVSVVAIPIAVFVPLLFIFPIVSFSTMFLVAAYSGICTRQPWRKYWDRLVPLVLIAMFYNSYLTVRAISKPDLVWKGEHLGFKQ